MCGTISPYTPTPTKHALFSVGIRCCAKPLSVLIVVQVANCLFLVVVVVVTVVVK